MLVACPSRHDWTSSVTEEQRERWETWSVPLREDPQWRGMALHTLFIGNDEVTANIDEHLGYATFAEPMFVPVWTCWADWQTIPWHQLESNWPGKEQVITHPIYQSVKDDAPVIKYWPLETQDIKSPRGWSVSMLWQETRGPSAPFFNAKILVPGSPWRGPPRRWIAFWPKRTSHMESGWPSWNKSALPRTWTQACAHINARLPSKLTGTPGQTGNQCNPPGSSSYRIGWDWDHIQYIKEEKIPMGDTRLAQEEEGQIVPWAVCNRGARVFEALRESMGTQKWENARPSGMHSFKDVQPVHERPVALQTSSRLAPSREWPEVYWLLSWGDPFLV